MTAAVQEGLSGERDRSSKFSLRLPLVNYIAIYLSISDI